MAIPKQTRLVVGLVLAGLLAVAPVSPAQTDIRRDPTVQAVEKAIGTVVNVSTATAVQIQDPFEEFFSEFFNPHRQRRPREHVDHSLGSGVIIDEDGYILTNNHVVQRGERTQIFVTINGKQYPARLEATSPARDVALLKVDLDQKLPSIRFAKDDDLLLGETVIALGDPFGLGISVSRGILSSTARRPQPEEGLLDYHDWLQTDAAINPGNSGGPLINLRGELIGLNVAVYRQNNAQGIGFAIPIKRVGEALSEMFTPENKGFWFGARIKSDLSSLSVLSVQPGSPAAKAGMQAGDVIVKIADKAPKNFIEFMVELIKRSQSQNVPLQISRAGKMRNLSVQIVREETVFNAELIRQKIGATLQPITPDVAEALGVNPGSGVVISGVDRNSPVAQAGLQPGMVVVGIDGKSATDLTGVAKLLYGKTKGTRALLDLRVLQRRGNFIVLVPHQAEIQVR